MFPHLTCIFYYIKRRIYGLDVSDKCRRCKNKLETITDIVSGCTTLAQKDYKRRHDKICLNVHWLLCKKYGIKVAEKWYQHQPDPVVENGTVKILWDFMIQCDRYIEHRRPDIVVMEKKTGKCRSLMWHAQTTMG